MDNPMNDNHRNIGQRLQMEMKKSGYSAAALAKRADVKSSFLYDVIRGKSVNPSSVKLARVAEILGVSLTYLAGTSDSPLVEGYKFALPQELQNYVLIPQLGVERGMIVTQAGEQPSCQFHRDWIKNELKVSPTDLRLAVIQGDSMSPTLHAGDIVLIDTTKKQPSPPGIFVMHDGMGLSAKRLEFIGSPASGKLRVACDNPHYSSYESLRDEASIIGRVVWFSRAL